MASRSCDGESGADARRFEGSDPPLEYIGRCVPSRYGDTLSSGLISSAPQIVASGAARVTPRGERDATPRIDPDPFPVFVPVLMRELGNSPRGVSEGGA